MPRLTRAKTVRSEERVRSYGDRRHIVNRYTVEYRGPDGVEYRKAFEATPPAWPDVPETIDRGDADETGDPETRPAAGLGYYVYVDAGDGDTLPTTPDPMPLTSVGAHLVEFMSRFARQGYYFNCRQEQVPLDRLSFAVRPADADEGDGPDTAAAEDGPPPGTTETGRLHWGMEKFGDSGWGLR